MSAPPTCTGCPQRGHSPVPLTSRSVPRNSTARAFSSTATRIVEAEAAGSPAPASRTSAVAGPRTPDPLIGD